MAVIRDVSVRNGCLLSHIDLFRQQFRQYGFTHITLYIGLSLNTVTYIVCQILSSLAIRRFSGFLPVFLDNQKATITTLFSYIIAFKFCSRCLPKA